MDRQHFLAGGGHCPVKGLFRDIAINKETLGKTDTAHVQGFGFGGLETLADDQFRGAATDIHHQPLASIIRQAVRHPQINQTSFLAPGDDLDIVPQHRFRPLDELPGIAGLTQGIGADHAHTAAGNTGNPLGKAAQAIQRPLLGVRVQSVIPVQPGPQLHFLGQPIQDLDLTMGLAGHYHVKAVRPQVNGRQMLAMFHMHSFPERPLPFSCPPRVDRELINAPEF